MDTHSMLPTGPDARAIAAGDAAVPKPGRGPQKAPRKVPLSIRMKPEILDAFRSTGPGWQMRLNAALADWLRTHSPEDLQV